MADKVNPIKSTGEKPTALQDAGGEVEPKHRYTPNVLDEGNRRNMPRWLRFPPLSPLRRLTRNRFWMYIAILGPGLVSAAAGDDAGGIATYASAGAAYGYQMLFAMVIVTVSLVLVQEMCARMGAVTGKGLSDLVREQFGVGWTLMVMLVVLVANTGLTISEFVGVAAAAELFNIPRWIAVPVVAFSVWWLITKGSYKVAEKVFLLLSAVFLSYIVSAFMANPDWGQVGKAFITPNFNLNASGLQLLVALIGTTITPYMQLFLQSSVVEKGVTPTDYKYTRFDTVVGAIFGDLISVFIIMATAATIYLHNGSTQITSAAEAAQALEPIAGSFDMALFGIGLFGASMLAAGVLPLATAYSVTESLGFEKGVSMSFEQAPVFMWLFTVLVVLGAVVAMIPGLPLFAFLIAVQVLNGALLPILLVFIVRLASNKEIMGQHTIGPVYKILAWATVIIITVAVLVMFFTMLFPGG